MTMPRCDLWVGVTLAVIFATSNSAVQAQEVNTAILKAADTCQKVAMRQALLAQSTISSTLRQFRETENQMKSYLSRWGARVVAGASSTRGNISACLDTYTKDIQAIDSDLDSQLIAKDKTAALWYDDRIFKVLTDVVSDASLANTVREVQDSLETSQKELSNQAVALLTKSVKNMRPTYQKVSRCIREQALIADPEL